MFDRITCLLPIERYDLFCILWSFYNVYLFNYLNKNLIKSTSQFETSSSTFYNIITVYIKVYKSSINVTITSSDFSDLDGEVGSNKTASIRDQCSLRDKKVDFKINMY